MRNILLLLVMLMGLNAQAQQVVASASGGGNAGGVLVDWTVGEMTLVNTASGGGLIVTQGFHQPIDGAIPTSEPYLEDGVVQVFPNPTSATLYIGTTLEPQHALDCQIFDLKGRLVQNAEFSNAPSMKQPETLNMQSLAAGTYLLRVNIAGKGNTVFKVVKVAQ
ncbi:MAG: T9SS type A sorting domain-containing protein [Saprospiraceae bacterium]|nr:T9SS type A sorting domain-containing protein [Saprospiraceae bacterium]